MRQLDRWEVDPLAASWLVLEGVEYECGGKMQLKSNDNRRLYCLKKHQENVREQEWVVYVRLRCGRIPPDPILSRCLDRNNPLDGGRLHPSLPESWVRVWLRSRQELYRRMVHRLHSSEALQKRMVSLKTECNMLRELAAPCASAIVPSHQSSLISSTWRYHRCKHMRTSHANHGLANSDRDNAF